MGKGILAPSEWALLEWEFCMFYHADTSYTLFLRQKRQAVPEEARKRETTVTTGSHLFILPFPVGKDTWDFPDP